MTCHDKHPTKEYVDKENHLDALWEDYALTRSPKELAVFIRAGGDLDADDPELIAGLLDAIPAAPSRRPSNRGLDLKTPGRIDHWIHDQELVKGRRPTLQEAFEHFAEQGGGSDAAWRGSYARGRKLLARIKKHKPVERVGNRPLSSLELRAIWQLAMAKRGLVAPKDEEIDPDIAAAFRAKLERDREK